MNDMEQLVRTRLHDLADDLPAADDDTANADVARVRHRRQRRNRLTVVALCAGLLVVAGGSTAIGALLSADRPSPAVTAPTPSVAPDTVPSTPAPTPTEVETRPATPTGPATGASTAAPGTSRPETTEDAPASWPAEAGAAQGGSYWAVFLAVAYDGAEQELQDALGSAHAVGYEAGIGDIGCTTGAREALGLDPGKSYEAVSIFFTTQADAQEFVDLYEPGVVGTALVTAGCMD